MKTIAGRIWSVNPFVYYYVSELPGEGGKDWGYTKKITEARPLSEYWQKRFAKDCKRVGSTAYFYEVTS